MQTEPLEAMEAMLTSSYRVQRVRTPKRKYDPTLTESPCTPKRATTPERAVRRKSVQTTPSSPEKIIKEELPLAPQTKSTNIWRRVTCTNLIQKRINFQEWRVVLPEHMKAPRPSFHSYGDAVQFCNMLHGTELKFVSITSTAEELGTINVDDDCSDDGGEENVDIDLESFFNDDTFEALIESQLTTPPPPLAPPTPPPTPPPTLIVDKRKFLKLPAAPLKTFNVSSKFTLSIVPVGMVSRPTVSPMAIATMQSMHTDFHPRTIENGIVTVESLNKELAKYPAKAARSKRSFKLKPRPAKEVLMEMKRIVAASRNRPGSPDLECSAHQEDTNVAAW
jgi:hypothetical protein